MPTLHWAHIAHRLVPEHGQPIAEEKGRRHRTQDDCVVVVVIRSVSLQILLGLKPAVIDNKTILLLPMHSLTSHNEIGLGACASRAKI